MKLPEKPDSYREALHHFCHVHTSHLEIHFDGDDVNRTVLADLRNGLDDAQIEYGVLKPGDASLIFPITRRNVDMIYLHKIQVAKPIFWRIRQALHARGEWRESPRCPELSVVERLDKLESDMEAISDALLRLEDDALLGIQTIAHNQTDNLEQIMQRLTALGYPNFSDAKEHPMENPSSALVRPSANRLLGKRAKDGWVVFRVTNEGDDEYMTEKPGVYSKSLDDAFFFHSSDELVNWIQSH